MAIMHPEDIENYKHTASELKLYEELRDQLPEKDHVFFSVRWFDKVDGVRVDSECDFLVFDPGFGFLAIECKGGLNISIENNHWTLTEKDEDGDIYKRELKKSPFAQAESSMRYFYDYFSNEFLQTFNGVYGFAVAFPNYSVNQSIESAADKELIIDFRHMSSLAHRINEIFHYWRGKRNNKVPFSSDQKQKFISLVNKRISLSAAAGALIPIKEKEFKKINYLQNSIIDFLSNYKQVQIVGGAGTGKTFMAIKKIQRELQHGHRVCYVCKSNELANFAASILPQKENLDCKSFNDLMCDILSIDSVQEVDSFFDQVDSVNHIYYDAIIVDEAQDFSVDEAMALRLLLKSQDESCLYVFMDKNQNLFEADFDSAFAIESKPYVLRYNIRNTGEIYKYAITETGLGRETIANQLLGVVPEIKRYKNRIQAISTISGIVNRLVQKEYVDISSIVILSDVPYSESVLSEENKIGIYPLTFSALNRDENAILFMTTGEFKGLESDIIIYIKNRIDSEIDGQLRNRENYVALTRARYYLYVIEKD